MTSFGDDGIGWVRRVGSQSLVEIIDLEKYLFTLGVEGAEIVLVPWVIIVTKVVKNLNCLDNALHRRRSERSDTRCHHRDAAGQTLTEFIIKLFECEWSWCS